MYIEP
jgi:hypothetical protein